MSIERYNKAFIQTLKVSEEELPGLHFNSTKLWDSIGHLTLMMAVEDAFDISLEPEDILSFQSYEDGRKILGKYGIIL